MGAARILFAAISLLVAASLRMSAQTSVWSLDRCVVYALQHNCDVLLQKADEAGRRQALSLSKLELLPTLYLNANQYYNWGRSVDMQELVIVRNRLTRQTSASAGASIALFDGFARINTISMNRCLADAAGSALRQAEFEVKADIARAYLANILAKLTGKRLAESYENICLLMERLEREVAVGTRGRSDMLEMEAKAADIRSQIAAAESEGRGQMQQLMAIMGCTEAFDTEAGYDMFYEAVPPAAWPDGSKAAPAVEVARSQVEAAKYALKVARGALLPSLTISAGYGTYYSDASPASFRDQFDGNRNPSVSLNLSLPVFDAGKTLTAVSRARNDLRESEIKLQQARQQDAMYQRDLLEQCTLLKQQCDICGEKCSLCRERMNQVTAEYEAGAITTSQWIDACEALSQSECELVQYMCKYLFQLKIMEYYRDGRSR